MNDISIACFLSVARTGSFTATASELSSTQQAVSRNVLSLEEELGFPLLDRSGRAVELTLEGERFYHWCRDLDRQLTLCEATARRLRRGSENPLRIGWCDWTGCPEALQDALAVFRESAPECTPDFLESTLPQILEFLQDSTLDIAVLPEFLTRDLADISVSVPFAEVPLYVVTDESVTFRGASPTITELTPLRQLAARFGSEPESRTRSRVEYLCTLLDIYPENLRLLPNIDSVLTELVCGPCYAILPRLAKAERMGPLVFWPTDISVPLVSVRTHLNRSPWAALLENCLRERSGSHE